MPDELEAAGVTPETADHTDMISDWGFEIGGEFHVKPRDLFEGTVDLGEDALGAAGNAVKDSVGAGAVAVGGVIDTGKGAVNAGKELVGRFLP